MITLENNRLTFRFPDVHPHAQCSIGFQRTLRIPDDDRTYPLPPGLGHFPLHHLDDFADRLPTESVRRGGVLTPMYQAEALWVSFSSSRYPIAVRVATGKICAVSGEFWSEGLADRPQNYLVLPGQPWLDGYCVSEGVIRQFVAMPLGDGYTAEEQLTGVAEHGGIQLAAYPMKPELYKQLRGHSARSVRRVREGSRPFLGLAPGGRMRQNIYNDRHGIHAWDLEHCTRCFVTIANSTQWMAITGTRPPTRPPTARRYAETGLPWFDYYDAEKEAIEGAAGLAGLASVAETGQLEGESPLSENESIKVPFVVGLKPGSGPERSGPRPVREPESVGDHP